MKKTFFLLFFSSVIYSQAKLENNKFQLNLVPGYSYWGTPVYFGCDYGLGNYSIGAELFYRKKIEDNYYNYDKEYDFYGVNIDLNYHFLKNSKVVDFYGGSSFNYYIWNTQLNDKLLGNNGFTDEFSEKHKGFGNGIQLGTRVFFGSKIALQIEGKMVVIYNEIIDPTVKVGLTYKL